jgi:hypothetical protein
MIAAIEERLGVVRIEPAGRAIIRDGTLEVAFAAVYVAAIIFGAVSGTRSCHRRAGPGDLAEVSTHRDGRNKSGHDNEKSQPKQKNALDP